MRLACLYLFLIIRFELLSYCRFQFTFHFHFLDVSMGFATITVS